MAKGAIKDGLLTLWHGGLGLVIWLAPVALGVAICFANPPVLENLRNLVFDHYQKIAPRQWTPDLPVRVIDIDDASLRKIGQWPWPRSRLAELAGKLHSLGAAAVVFDILFAEQDRLTPESMLEQLPDLPERRVFHDALAAKGLVTADTLAETLAKTQSVLAMVLTFDGAAHGITLKTGFATAGDDPIPFLTRFHNAILPLPRLAENAAGLGSINWIPDRDLIVRKAPLIFGIDGSNGMPMLVPSLDAEALRVAQAANTIIVKSSNASGAEAYGASTGVISIKIGEAQIDTESDGMVRVRFAGSQPGRHIPAWRVLDDTVTSDELNGKIALVGWTASALADLRSTPLEAAVPGIDIHAELLEHIASGAHLARPDYAPGLEAALLVIGGFAAAAAARFANPVAAALLTILLITGFAAASFFVFLRADLLFDPIMPPATSLAAYTTMTVAVYWRSERQRRFVRQAFGRYLAPLIVERLAKDPASLKLGGEAREVSVLFSDIRDFTARAETMSAQEVVQFLNSLHTPMTEIVLAESGTIDKYIGNGLMAFWNAPADVSNYAERACRSALAMCRAVALLDAKATLETVKARRDYIPIQIGVGISTGEVFVGNIGSQHRFDYSIIGDTVNVAARLEQATKALGVSIAVCETTVRAAPNFLFLSMGKIDIKGKSQPLKVYALHGPVTENAKDFELFAALHEKVLEALERRDPQIRDVIAAAKAHPQSTGYLKFYERCARGLS